MRHADAELALWLARQRIEQDHRDTVLARQLPPRPSTRDALRRRAGEALIEAGRRLLPPPQASRSRAT